MLMLGAATVLTHPALVQAAVAEPGAEVVTQDPGGSLPDDGVRDPAADAATAPASAKRAAPTDTAPATNAGPADSIAKTAQLATVSVVAARRTPKERALSSVKPVDVITTDEIRATGATTVQQALFRLLPSANFPQNEYSANAIGKARSIALRGLTPGQTLILVNGHRQHQSAYVQVGTSSFSKGDEPTDLNTIPISAIDHIEVLRDGAATQYGADGLAGVVNIVLKSSPEGGGLSVQTGKYTKGDGFGKQFSGWKGFALPGHGSAVISFSTDNTNRTDTSVNDTRQYYFADDPREADAKYRHWPKGQGSPYVSQQNVALNAQTHLADNVELYAFGNYSHALKSSGLYFTRPQDNNNVRAIYPDGFQPDASGRNYDAQGTVGLKFGDERIGVFDFSGSWAQNRYEQSVDNTVNASYGLASPTSFHIANWILQEQSVRLDYTKTFEHALFAQPLTIRSGIEFRHDRHTLEPGDPASYLYGGVPVLDGPNGGAATGAGAQAFQGVAASAAGSLSRTTGAFYFDAEQRLTDKFRIDIGGRIEHYSDLGPTGLAGNISGRYDFSPALGLRANLSAGVRPPGLGQLNDASSSILIDAVTQQVLNTLLARPTDAVARAVGAKPLEAEKSTTMSLGFVLRPVEHGSVTVDAYLTNIRGRITPTDTLSGTAVRSALSAAGYSNVSAIQFFTNAANTRDMGIDVTGNYQLNLHQYGYTDLFIAFNANQTKITSIAGNSVIPGLALIGPQMQDLIEHSSPNNKLVIGGTHHIGRFDVYADATRYGTYSAVGTSTTSTLIRQKFSPQWVVDLNVAYRATKKLRVSVGALNLFGSHPDRSIFPINFGVTPYNALAPAGGEGTFVYANLNYDF
ncbi:TonB-dependent receptor [Paraburkholderia tropica]|uniref:TonB-dependent receptor plug domain-containing protein n=1 Tax=Paraburkholderia tropica TaxID=92647 RepID=UPI0030165E59